MQKLLDAVLHPVLVLLIAVALLGAIGHCSVQAGNCIHPFIGDCVLSAGNKVVAESDVLCRSSVAGQAQDQCQHNHLTGKHVTWSKSIAPSVALVVGLQMDAHLSQFQCVPCCTQCSMPAGAQLCYTGALVQ